MALVVPPPLPQVPFRLTRDVVDGFGAAGVAGAFERGCEVTMGVLRRDAQSLLTILEVGTGVPCNTAM